MDIAPIVERRQPEVSAGRRRLQRELLVIFDRRQRQTGDLREASVLSIGNLHLHILGSTSSILHLRSIEGEAGDLALILQLKYEDLGRQVT